MSAGLILAVTVSAVCAAATPVSVDDVVRDAVAHNKDLLQRRLEARRAAAQETAAWWGFAPELDVRAGVSNVKSTTGNLLLGDSSGTLPLPFDPSNATTSAESGIGLNWSTPIGTRVGAQLDLSRDFAGPKTSNTGVVVLSLTQPILQDAWLPGASFSLDEARLGARIARETLRGEVEQFVAQVEGAYWDLALAQADVDIKTRSLERARQQREDTAENIRRGILADAEIYLVDENLVFFEQLLEQAVEDRESSRRRLANLLWMEPGAPIVVSETLSELNGREADAVDVDSAMDITAENSPALAAERTKAELARDRERAAFMHALPRLDVNGSVALSPAGTNGDSALNHLAAATKTPDAGVGVTFSLPLGQPAVQASVDAERAESERAKLELESTELALRHAVEGAAAQLSLALRLEKLGRRQLDLEGKKLDAQVDKYKQGLSTLADVVRFQRDLDDAAISLRRAVRAVHVARAQLLALEGKLAESASIEVAK